MALQNLQRRRITTRGKRIKGLHQFNLAIAQGLENFSVFEQTVVVQISRCDVLGWDISHVEFPTIDQTVVVEVRVCKDLLRSFPARLNVLGVHGFDWFHRLNGEIALVPSHQN